MHLYSLCSMLSHAHYFLQAKKIVVFLGRASPTHMIKELMKELEVCNSDVTKDVSISVHLLECRAGTCRLGNTGQVTVC